MRQVFPLILRTEEDLVAVQKIESSGHPYIVRGQVLNVTFAYIVIYPQGDLVCLADEGIDLESLSFAPAKVAALRYLEPGFSKNRDDLAIASMFAAIRLLEVEIDRLIKLHKNHRSVTESFLQDSVEIKPMPAVEKGYVYFIQASESKRIKIGFSAHPQKRLEALQTGNPEILFLLGRYPGTYEDESAAHQMFRHLRLAGEWFSPGEELMEYVRCRCRSGRKGSTLEKAVRALL